MSKVKNRKPTVMKCGILPSNNHFFEIAFPYEDDKWYLQSIVTKNPCGEEFDIPFKTLYDIFCGGKK